MRSPTIAAMKPIQQLLQHAQANDAVATEALVREFYGVVLRLCLSVLVDQNEAEDAAQETFIAAARNLPRYRGDADPKTWLYAIAINVCRGQLRKRRSRRFLEDSLKVIIGLFQKPADPEQLALQLETDRQVWRAVDSLGDKHRLPVILRYVHGLSAPEISVALNISEGTVHSRLYYARKYLQAQLRASAAQEEDIFHEPFS
jgi:RNA polymerase sigma-70 factor (ECF subfamily)